ncbi:MAG TPA: type II toxin-antitoxin system VapC family toxin [Bacteroidetes bacterium]|nr:type II toxin-antitoxin system VapC family toxin [Bacteroidota bacterium]
MIIDTDVLIWYMRGNKKAYNLIEGLSSFYISVITYMELVQGMRNKNELNELRKALRTWNTKILYVTEEISSKAMFFLEKHYLSHSLEIADSLIAATSISSALPLLTGNDKHYKILSDLELKVFHP